MGRPRKSVAEKKADGSYCRSADGEEAPMTNAEITPPPWLRKESRKTFIQIKKILGEKKMDKSEYAILLELLADAITDRNLIREKLRETGGPIVESKTGLMKKNPYSELLLIREKQVAQLLSRFGLTPDSQAKTAIPFRNQMFSAPTGTDKFLSED